MRKPKPDKPDFVHRSFYMRDHIHSCRVEHLVRHIAIDMVLYRLYDVLYLLPGNGLWYLLRAPQILAFGLNCGYPKRDIALYLVWWLRCCGLTKEKWDADRDRAMMGGRKWLLHLKAIRKNMLKRKSYAMIPECSKVKN